MMREAQKMMQSPEFQAHMKRVTENPSFKKAMEGTKEMMKDPQKVAEMEAKVKAAVTEGEKQLSELEAAKKAAADAAPTEESTADEKAPAEDEVLDVPNLNIN